jgi:hypothetical protein
MNANGQPQGSIDLRLFNANRDRFPVEQLLAHAGKQIAWSADGTRIVASADTPEEVYRQLDERGIPVSQVVLDYVDDTDGIM